MTYAPLAEFEALKKKVEDKDTGLVAKVAEKDWVRDMALFRSTLQSLSGSLQAAKGDLQAVTASAQLFKADYSVWKFDEKGFTFLGKPIFKTEDFSKRQNAWVDKQLEKLKVSIARLKAQVGTLARQGAAKAVSLPGKGAAKVSSAAQAAKDQLAKLNGLIQRASANVRDLISRSTATIKGQMEKVSNLRRNTSRAQKEVTELEKNAKILKQMPEIGKAAKNARSQVEGMTKAVNEASKELDR